MHGETLRWSVGPWTELSAPAKQVRTAVFTQEMGIDADIDFDGTDGDSLHIVAFDRDLPVGTGRLRAVDGRIGRMAVLPDWRRRSLGSQILSRLVRECVRAGMDEIGLHAQDHATGFYARHGFEAEGPLFEEAEIPHQLMRRKLSWRRAVAGALVRDGKILLGLRAAHLTKGDHWDLFGGKVEAGETDEEALVREIDEELNLRIKPGRFLSVLLYDGQARREIWRCPVHTIQEWEGELRLNDEHQSACWFAPEDLPQLRLTHTRLISLAKKAAKVNERV